MAEMHPRWHSLGDEAEVPVRAADAIQPPQPISRVRIGATSVSRLPGAVIGILFAVTLGIMLTRSLPTLWEQARNLLGALPSVSGTVATVSGGATSGAQDIGTEEPPSSPSGPTLRTEDGKTTGAVLLAQAASGEQSSAEEPEPLRQNEASSEAAANIPINPYSVGSGIERPLDAMGNPPSGETHNAATNDDNALQTFLRPTTQPQSGPGLWIVFAAAVGAMAWQWKRLTCATLRATAARP